MDFTGERMIPELNKDDEIYLEHMNRYLFASQFAKEKIVLDIACGTGYGSNLLAEAGAKSVTGMDISEEAINYSKNKYHSKSLEFQVGDVEKIPLEDKKMDVVVSLETIEHVDRKKQQLFLTEVERVLKEDGLFVVSTPNPLVYPKGNPFHVAELSKDEFRNLLGKHFKYVEIFYQDCVEGDYIFSEDKLKEEIISSQKNGVSFQKINTLPVSGNMYLIAVCSNRKLSQQINGFVAVSNKKPRILWQIYQKNAERAESVIKQKQNELQKKEDELKKRADSCKHEIKEVTIRLNQKLKEKERKIIELNQAIQKKDVKVQQKENVIAKKENIIQHKEAEIKMMKSSKFWKMRGKYLSIKKKLSRRG